MQPSQMATTMSRAMGQCARPLRHENIRRLFHSLPDFFLQPPGSRRLSSCCSSSLLVYECNFKFSSNSNSEHTRPFGTSASQRLKQMPPRPRPPPENEIEESFLKGSGPGGQKINKTNSAVQLRHKPTGVVVKSQATRSREQNRKIARELLAARLDDLTRGDESRSAVVGEVRRKRAASKAKKSRRKYRRLADEDEDEEEKEEGDYNDKEVEVGGEEGRGEETEKEKEKDKAGARAGIETDSPKENAAASNDRDASR